MKPYYYIHSHGTVAPTPAVKHPTVEAAQAEAACLARKHPGRTFEILQAIALTSVTLPEPATFWMDGQRRPRTSWDQTAYDILADLGDGWSLIAHPNGPCITNGDILSVIDIHENDELAAIKKFAQEAYRQWSWLKLRSTMTFPTP
jgi:hypothetical protein